MALARNQITLIDVNDGYVGGDGKSYVLNILGGQRSVVYDQDGTGYSPAPTSFTAELVVDGVVTTPTTYAWSAQGHLSGTGNGASFTPSYAASFNNLLSAGDAVFLTVTYNGMTIRNAAPIAVSKIGTNGVPTYTWVRYADDINGNGINDLPAGKAYIGFAHNKLTPTESNLPEDYVWSLIKGDDGDSSYLWIRYSQVADGTDFVTSPANAVYIGVATTSTPSAPTLKGAYNWSLIKGPQGIKGDSSYLHIKYSNDGGATFTTNGGEDVGSWIGTYSDLNEADSTSVSDYTWVKVKGEDGKGISSTTVTYQASTSGVTAPTGTWEPTIPTVNENQYLWTRTVITYTSGSPSTSYSVGKMGKAGADGNGITSTLVQYQVGTSGTSAPTGNWIADVPNVPEGNFLWTKTTINYATGDPSIAYSVARAASNGLPGRGITATTIEYASSTSGVTPPATGWGTSVPTVSPSSFLWTRTTTTYSSGDPTVSYSVGGMGKNGTDGKGITSTSLSYQASASGTTIPSTWDAGIPTVTQGQYLWTRTTFNYTSGTPTYSYSVARMGNDAKLVKINASATIFKSPDGGANFAPNSIILTPTFQGGVTYSNWQVSTNGGSTWVTAAGQNGVTIASGVLTLAKTSTLFTVSITSLVFKVNTSDAAVSDTITISKLYDVVDLSQQAIFDKLTGGGVNEGLFLSDGKVYINGTYIRTGNLVAGNAMIQNGYLNTAVIQDGTIVTAKIGDAQITNAKIADLAVTTAKIGNAQITNAKIANLAVDSAKIADAAITTAKIGEAQITNAKIANATIEAAKIKSINADTITTGSLSASRIQGGTLTMGGSGNGNGLILIKDLLNRQVMKLDKDGLIIDMFYNEVGEPTNQFLIRDGATQLELLRIGASGELIYNGVATFNELYLDSTLYLWADLNAWGNTVINGSGNLGVQDQRSLNMPTNLGEKGVRFDFKSNSAQGLSDGGTYHSTMTIQPWSDSSGGSIAQLAFTSNGNMWLRSTPIGGTWPGWKRVWDSGSFNPDLYVPQSQIGSMGYSFTAAANTIVARNANGYVYATYYNSNRGDENSAAASYIYDSGDGWMRKKSLATVRSEIVNYSTVQPAIKGGLYVNSGFYLHTSSASGKYVIFDNSVSGSQGSEPVIRPSTSGGWGGIGATGAPWFKGYSYGWVTSSDKNLKGEIVPFSGQEGYDLVKDLKFYSYRYYKGNKAEGDLRWEHSLGVVAQEAPYEIKSYAQDGTSEEAIDLYSYATLLGVATQEMQKKVEITEERANTLENTVAELQERLASLTNLVQELLVK